MINISEYIMYWQLILAVNDYNKESTKKEDLKPVKKQKGLLGQFIELLVAPFRRK